MGRQRKQLPLAIEHDPAAIGLSSHIVTTRFGPLHYVGPATRTHQEAVLFLHGFGSRWTVWTPLVKALVALQFLPKCDFLLIDLPGFGKSANHLSHLRSAELGNELITLAHRLGYRTIRLAGHSMGGFLALDIAAQYPNAIRSVHIVSGSYFSLLTMVNHPLRGWLRTPKIALFYVLQRFLAHHKKAAMVANYLLQRKPGSTLRSLYIVGGPGFLYAAQNGVHYNARKIWGSITMPVYGVFGEHDQLVPQQDMRELQSVLPKAKLSLIKNAKHSSLVEKPYEVARALFKIGQG